MLFVLTLSVAYAANRYSIYKEKTGFLGLGGTRSFMLDNQTGATWVYEDKAWVPIAKLEEGVVQIDEIQVKALQEEEINALTKKHEEEIRALKEKQANDIQALKAELEENLKASKKPAPTVRKTSTTRAKKATYTRKRSKPVPKPAVDSSDSEDEAPGWLTE